MKSHLLTLVRGFVPVQSAFKCETGHLLPIQKPGFHQRHKPKRKHKRKHNSHFTVKMASTQVQTQAQAQGLNYFFLCQCSCFSSFVFTWHINFMLAFVLLSVLASLAKTRLKSRLRTLDFKFFAFLTTIILSDFKFHCIYLIFSVDIQLIVNQLQCIRLW